jgi:hypothetical protein
MLARLEKGNFCNLVTGDESWSALQFQHSAKWEVSRDDVTQNGRQPISPSKFMITVVWDVDSFHVVNLITSQETFNSQYFVDNVLTHLLPKIVPQGRRRHALRLHCHIYNCRVHFAKVSEQFSLKMKLSMYLIRLIVQI